MPTYDFACPDCNTQFEKNVPLADIDKPVECTNCSKKNTKRCVSAGRVSYSGFKSNLRRAGSGWNDVLKKVKKGSGKENSIHTR